MSQWACKQLTENIKRTKTLDDTVLRSLQGQVRDDLVSLNTRQAEISAMETAIKKKETEIESNLVAASTAGEDAGKTQQRSLAGKEIEELEAQLERTQFLLLRCTNR